MADILGGAYQLTQYMVGGERCDHPVDRTLRCAVMEVGHLERQAGEYGGGQAGQDAPAWQVHDLYPFPVFPQVRDVGRIDPLVG